MICLSQIRTVQALQNQCLSHSDLPLPPRPASPSSPTRLICGSALEQPMPL